MYVILNITDASSSNRECLNSRSRSAMLRFGSFPLVSPFFLREPLPFAAKNYQVYLSQDKNKQNVPVHEAINTASTIAKHNYKKINCV